VVVQAALADGETRVEVSRPDGVEAVAVYGVLQHVVHEAVACLVHFTERQELVALDDQHPVPDLSPDEAGEEPRAEDPKQTCRPQVRDQRDQISAGAVAEDGQSFCLLTRQELLQIDFLAAFGWVPLPWTRAAAGLR
jgi:hypothetical protein